MALIDPDLSGLTDGANADAADVSNPLNTVIDEINGRLDTNNFAAASTNLETIASSQQWTTWSSPAYTGFSANPTQTLRYLKVGRMVTVEAAVTNAAGTSNATTFTMTLPYAAAIDVRYPVWAVDNTSTTTVGRADTAVSSTTLSLYTSIGGAAWTASGTKGVSFCFTYEATS